MKSGLILSLLMVSAAGAASWVWMDPETAPMPPSLAAELEWQEERLPLLAHEPAVLIPASTTEGMQRSPMEHEGHASGIVRRNLPTIAEEEPEMVAYACSGGSGRTVEKNNTFYTVSRRSIDWPKARKTPSGKGITAALNWLSNQASRKGSWESDDEGATAAALLAFMGGGHTLSAGRYKRVVSNGINWLKESQTKEGFFGTPYGEEALHDHAMATLAMGESYFYSSQTPVLKRPMKRAVGVLDRAAKEGSAWGTNALPGSNPDSRVTNWTLMALHQAKASYLVVAEKHHAGVKAWIDWRIAKEPSHGVRADTLRVMDLYLTMLQTEQGILQDWSDHPEYPRMQEQVSHLLHVLPIWSRDPHTVDLQTWLLATEAMHQWGGPAWKTWKATTWQTFLDLQLKGAKGDALRGSWNPKGQWSREGGRVYVTAMCAYILEIPYRRGSLLNASHGIGLEEIADVPATH